MGHVVMQGTVSPPFATKAPFYALLEFEAISGETVDQAMEIFEHCTESGWVVDGVMSQNATQARNLWRLREDISESIVHTLFWLFKMVNCFMKNTTMATQKTQ